MPAATGWAGFARRESTVEEEGKRPHSTHISSGGEYIKQDAGSPHKFALLRARRKRKSLSKKSQSHWLFRFFIPENRNNQCDWDFSGFRLERQNAGAVAERFLLHAQLVEHSKKEIRHRRLLWGHDVTVAFELAARATENHE